MRYYFSIDVSTRHQSPIEDEDDILDGFLSSRKKKFKQRESETEMEKRKRMAADVGFDAVEIEDLIADIESDDELSAASNDAEKHDGNHSTNRHIEVKKKDQNEKEKRVASDCIPSQQASLFSSSLTSANPSRRNMSLPPLRARVNSLPPLRGKKL